eukprot:464733_1
MLAHESDHKQQHIENNNNDVMELDELSELIEYNTMDLKVYKHRKHNSYHHPKYMLNNDEHDPYISAINPHFKTNENDWIIFTNKQTDKICIPLYGEIQCNGYIQDVKKMRLEIGNLEKNIWIPLNKNNSHIIHIIDFGLSKQYINSKTNKHIKYGENMRLIGSSKHVSINTHLGIKQSRRDDMESLGYIFVKFMKNKMPWDGIKANTKKEKYNKIAELKMTVTTDELCKGLPNEFVLYINYCKALKFDEKPDYEYLKSLFKNVFLRMGYCCQNMFNMKRNAMFILPERKYYSYDEIIKMDQLQCDKNTWLICNFITSKDMIWSKILHSKKYRKYVCMELIQPNDIVYVYIRQCCIVIQFIPNVIKSLISTYCAISCQYIVKK